jgi:hypothetical protein
MPALHIVMAGLDPAIYALPCARIYVNEGVDHRVELGDDDPGVEAGLTPAMTVEQRCPMSKELR